MCSRNVLYLFLHFYLILPGSRDLLGFYCRQGCHFPDDMKFPVFSRPRLGSIMSPRPFGGGGGRGHAPQKIFKD